MNLETLKASHYYFKGLISSEPYLNGNAPGMTGYAWLLCYLSGNPVDWIEIAAVRKTISRERGLLTRSSGYTDFTPSEDYYGWIAGTAANERKATLYADSALEIEDYWDRHWGIFNSRQPGCPVLWDRLFSKSPWKAGAPLFSRFPALYTHLTYAIGRDTPSEGYKQAWIAALKSGANSRSQDGKMQNWAMIQTYYNQKHKDPECDFAAQAWWWTLKNQYGSMKGVAEAYGLPPDHPLYSWGDYEKGI